MCQIGASVTKKNLHNRTPNAPPQIILINGNKNTTILCFIGKIYSQEY